MMCGFVGIFGKAASANSLESPLQVIRHRGPNGCASHEVPGFAIGFSRLAIVPPLAFVGLSQGPEGQVLALNGEIFYGAEELCGRTDTEVLHERIRHRGLEELPRLRGLFAFSLYDENGLHLVRDRFGIKPLYYAYMSDGSIAFASEMKALLAMPGIDRAVDDEVVASFRVLGYNVFPGRTPFQRIRSIAPGTCRTFGVDGCERLLRFVETQEPEHSDAPPSCEGSAVACQTEELLQQSLRRSCLHDPNSKALFFSGGLDSACLLTLALQHGDIAPFTLWDGHNADDLNDAKALCDHLGCELAVVTASTEEVDRAIVHYAWSFEHPIGGSGFDLFGGVAFHVLARHVAARHRVAFCGEGADELFLGYHPYHMRPALLRNRLQAELSSVRCQALAERLHDLGLLGRGAILEKATRRLAACEGLSEYHLPSVDRSGMAFGLEIRPPYLDCDLAEFVDTLPASFLIDRKHEWTKLPLRSLLRRYLTLTTVRSAVRRKRAMAYALQSQTSEIEAKVRSLCPGLSLRELFWRLFFHLHTDQKTYSPPGVRFTELLPMLSRTECPLCESF